MRYWQTNNICYKASSSLLNYFKFLSKQKKYFYQLLVMLKEKTIYFKGKQINIFEQIQTISCF